MLGFKSRLQRVLKIIRQIRYLLITHGDMSNAFVKKKKSKYDFFLNRICVLFYVRSNYLLPWAPMTGHSGDRNGQTINRLLGQLASLRGDPQNKEAQDTGVKKTSAKEKSSLTYELYYKPEYSKLQQAQQVKLNIFWITVAWVRIAIVFCSSRKHQKTTFHEFPTLTL